MTNDTPQIRLAVPDDAPAIASVLHESFVEFEPLYTPEGFSATTPGLDRILARWSEGPVWVAVLGGVVIGTVAAVPRGEGLYVRSMAVHPAARGQHLGELLLRQVEDYATAQGHTRMYLSTTPFLSAAIRLYENWGFRRINEGPQDLFGTPLFTMEKYV
jgi:GNAT superfamily N-acetyltransferase